MSMPRRRLIRPEPNSSTSENHQQLHKLRTRLEQERKIFTRLMSRLRRTFHAVEKSERRLNRVERQIAHLEE
jgi:hypothetical protein